MHKYLSNSYITWSVQLCFIGGLGIEGEDDSYDFGTGN